MMCALSETADDMKAWRVDREVVAVVVAVVKLTRRK